jgi:phosphatidylglycerophosphate synthase
MRDAVLRRQKDQWLTPIVKNQMSTVHPNLLSFLALLVGLAAALAIALHYSWLGLLLWLLNRVLDGIDGLVARIHQKQSDFGGYLDLMLDFVVYLALPIAFLAANPTAANLWSGIFLISIYVLNTVSWTVLAALLEKRQMTSKRLTSLEMPTGLIEGAETIVFYTLFCILPGYIAYLFTLMAVLVAITALQRVWWAWKNL